MNKIQVLDSIAHYFIKPGKSILAHTKPNSIETFNCALKNGKLGIEAEAALGDASLFTESLLKKQFKKANSQMTEIFGNLSSVELVQGRPKGALSIITKQKRALKKGDFNSIQDAVKVIEDGIGTRVITKSLPKLKNSEIDKMVSSMEIEGKKLTPKQVQLLKSYIYEKPITPEEKDEAFQLFERFARPLVESRSREVVDELTLGILKHNINTYGVSLEELSSCGLFREDLIKRLTSEKISPINITEINNYRGKYGLAEFSNNQIAQLSKALSYGNPKGSAGLKIISDPKGLDYCRFSPETLEKCAEKSVKASGYRTAQMNIIHENKALGEIQFRGIETNRIGEYEHIAYDLRQEKETLGREFKPFKKAIQSLSDSDYAQYNEYLESCYNYYNRLELGLPAIKPRLPKKFPKILSEESLKSLHDLSENIQKELGKGFERHFKSVA